MAAESTPDTGYDVLTAEAYTRYREGLDDTVRLELDLYEKLASNVRTMRVLYLAMLNLDKGLLPADVGADELARAKTNGLVYLSGRRLRATRDGFTLLWQWKTEIEPHIRKTPFQGLWRQVLGW